MCGFAATNYSDPIISNKHCQNRGPDMTTAEKIRGVYYLHNLLHITGELTPQPLIKDDVVCVFNGEIYNYTSFGNYNSDSECIIDLYNTKGEHFVKELDGEFALCLIDYKKQKLIISVDTFSCKPLWYEMRDDKFCIASYNSQLHGLGFKNGKKLKSNTTLVSVSYTHLTLPTTPYV